MLAIVYALRRFRILHGIEFKIITELQSFDYMIEHREGRKMTHVDGLIRCNMIGIVHDNSFETNLVVVQNKDSRIVEIQRKIEVA